jgi:hypothetical protein
LRRKQHGYQDFARLNSLSTRRRGFRFSIVDLTAIGACALATWLLFEELDSFVWLLPVTLGHFFLFCNVFRICRRLELIWSVLFVINVASFVIINRFAWLPILAIQSLVTVTVITLEIKSSRYHGIFCSNEPNH